MKSLIAKSGMCAEPVLATRADGLGRKSAAGSNESRGTGLESPFRAPKEDPEGWEVRRQETCRSDREL